MLLSFLLVATLQAPAQDTSMANAIALLRSDVRASKAELIGRALALPDSQAQVFWPMYREFEAETAKLWDQRVQLIKDYVAAYDSLSDAKARDLTQRAFAIDEQRVKLNKSTFNKFAKKLPVKTVAHFFQLDGFLNRVMELKVVAALPEIR
ncbi:MAG TPA: hypothetical protein VGU74_15635 [Gemmatimonadales bacterium]|nr:hypothetical protein [Gemmatimonadales bacterium]